MLSRAAFGAKEGWQYKAVVPVAEIAVSLDDYPALGGLLELRDGA